MTEFAYLLYLALAIAVTVGVAWALARNGMVFLTDYFGDEKLAESANRLLVAGFLLVNIGFITLTLSLGEAPRTAVEVIRFVSTKTGLAVLVVGAMHYFNMGALARYGRKVNSWLAEERTPLPL